MENLISLKEYALIHGKDDGNLRRMAAAGKFKTARKLGNIWVIDPDEPFIDGRVKTGQYAKSHREQ